MAPFSRLLLVLVAAICISLLRRTVLPRLAQTVAAWFPTVAQWIGLSKPPPENAAAIVETTAITSRTVVPPLETYIPSSVQRREVTAVVTKPSASALELDDDDDEEEDGEEVEDDEWDTEDDDDHDDEIELSGDAKYKRIVRVEEEDEDEADDNTNDANTIDTTASTEMLFEDEGWGQACLVAKEQVADSTLIKLSFALPRTTDYLPLAVGDKVRLCVVAGSSPPVVREDETDGDEIDDDDADGTPLVAEVYPFGDASSGQFSFLVENPSLMEDNDDDDEPDAASSRLLVRTILDEFQPGDELAIQPALPPDSAVLEWIAPWQITQNNIHTIMYWANGSGISPALDHVRIILDDEDDDNDGKEDNGVQNANLLWVNNAVGDFTYAENDLEEQYERHGDRLAIACVAEDAPSAADDIAAAIVPYTPGVLAVLSGPRSYTADAARFLIDSQGYPEAAICVL
jgi:hypothetical protein